MRNYVRCLCAAFLLSPLLAFAEPLVIYFQPAWMYAAEEARYEAQLAQALSTGQDSPGLLPGALLRDGHGFIQVKADRTPHTIT